MLSIFMEHKILSGCIIGLLLISIILQVWIGVYLYRLIQETENMTTTNNKFLKQCKLKFTNCYQLNEGVQNIQVFVDKLLGKIRICGISLQVIKHLAGQVMLLAVFASGYGACIGIINGNTLAEILPFYIISLWGLYIYFSVSSIVDINGKKAILKTYLIDYLENHMVNKLSMLKFDIKRIEGEENLENDTEAKIKHSNNELGDDKVNTKDLNPTGSVQKLAFTSKAEKELEELLQEYFT